jgi:quinolinate synthase
MLKLDVHSQDDCPAEEFKAFKENHPEHFVVSYINCTAAVKAQSDLICTSSNAVDLVNQIPTDKPILFAPDRNLGTVGAAPKWS